MLEFLLKLFDTDDFPARWHCGRWSDGHGWLHIISDLSIFAAYLAIPVVLATFVVKRKDVPFPRIFWLFGGFIASCGTVHLIEAIIFWYPVYRLDGVVKLVTALASWGTVIALVPVIPRALSLRTPESLEREVALRTRELAEEKAKLEAVLASLGVGVVVFDPNGEVTMANQASRALLGEDVHGVAVGEWIGRYALRAPDTGAPLGEADFPAAAALRQEKASGERDLLVRPAAADRDAFFTLSAQPIIGEARLGAVMVFTDVTARRSMENQLQSTNRELERSNADLERFAYVASHDLQEPLRMVAMYTELLGERYSGQLDDKAQKYIDYAMDGAQRMRRLIDDLLLFSRVQSSAQPASPTALGAVVDEALELLAARIEETGARIDFDDLPTVSADPAQLRQVLTNLIGNALKYLPPDTIPEVRIRAEREDSGWVISVKDNGLGVDPAHHARIFEIFQRLHARDAYPGTGIGLAIVKRVVERHGGRVWLESELGAGATFYFSLPDA
ncbi:MAG: PAS domain-containing protein [Polyangiaceae bacterium]|nr:PAS domain-containing protein [Polyangiaceae bacterium]